MPDISKLKELAFKWAQEKLPPESLMPHLIEPFNPLLEQLRDVQAERAQDRETPEQMEARTERRARERLWRQYGATLSALMQNHYAEVAWLLQRQISIPDAKDRLLALDAALEAAM